MRIGWLLGLGLLGLGPGCGSNEDAVCSAKCDCESCSDREYSDCLDHFDADARSADRLDCGPEYDDLLACEDDTGRCHGSEFDTDCGPERDRLERCLGDETASCVVDADCPGGGHPFCAPSLRCVECVTSSQCDKNQSCVANECK